MDVGCKRRGKKAVNEHRSRRMLWSVSLQLLGLPYSFPFSGFCRAEMCAFALLTLMLGQKDKKQYRDMEGVFEEGQNSETIKMSVKSL